MSEIRVRSLVNFPGLRLAATFFGDELADPVILSLRADNFHTRGAFKLNGLPHAEHVRSEHNARQARTSHQSVGTSTTRCWCSVG